jgi:hypothetical protein
VKYLQALILLGHPLILGKHLSRRILPLSRDIEEFLIPKIPATLQLKEPHKIISRAILKHEYYVNRFVKTILGMFDQSNKQTFIVDKAYMNQTR